MANKGQAMVNGVISALGSSGITLKKDFSKDHPDVQKIVSDYTIAITQGKRLGATLDILRQCFDVDRVKIL